MANNVTKLHESWKDRLKERIDAAPEHANFLLVLVDEGKSQYQYTLGEDMPMEKLALITLNLQNVVMGR